MKTPSTPFRMTKPGTPGRRAARWLNDGAVIRATIAAKDPEHQAKFLPRRSLASGGAA